MAWVWAWETLVSAPLYSKSGQAYFYNYSETHKKWMNKKRVRSAYKTAASSNQIRKFPHTPSVQQGECL